MERVIDSLNSAAKKAQKEYYLILFCFVCEAAFISMIALIMSIIYYFIFTSFFKLIVEIYIKIFNNELLVYIVAMILISRAFDNYLLMRCRRRYAGLVIKDTDDAKFYLIRSGFDLQVISESQRVCLLDYMVAKDGMLKGDISQNIYYILIVGSLGSYVATKLIDYDSVLGIVAFLSFIIFVRKISFLKRFELRKYLMLWPAKNV
ncbi:hypothetical protein PCS_02107 [Desulfocurvibacter africanus PCS]|uniref:Uncharacterized protein n=1 Tax=Desulfocurvibacter africanus PCS TaxID=1262666 RepID=M5PT13_DESAF|nr:hypothetical protein [Desulfocurvibacter africanus]EMG37269.1 hypothetical protein PCS_02107 [Desulfocurvibacter africanus PCS]